jgi:hypothetical protein
MVKYRIEEELRHGKVWFWPQKSEDGVYWATLIGCGNRTLEGARKNLEEYKRRTPNKVLKHHYE